MKKLILTFSLMIPNIVSACPDLEGTWLSSKEKFVEFNKKWANVETIAWDFMLQNQGIETIEFKPDNTMVISTPEVELVVGERKVKSPASKESIDFSILGCNKRSIAIMYERYGETQISKFHFENPNIYWEYMGVAGRSGNGHIREFYTKVR